MCKRFYVNNNGIRPSLSKKLGPLFSGMFETSRLKKMGFASFPTLKTLQFEIINAKTFQKWNKNFHFIGTLKDPSQPPPFSMPSKLLILHGEAKSYCFTVSCVPESVFNYLQQFHSDFHSFDMLRIKYNSQTLTCKQKQRCG